MIRWKNNLSFYTLKYFEWKMFCIKPFGGSEGDVECVPAFFNWQVPAGALTSAGVA